MALICFLASARHVIPEPYTGIQSEGKYIAAIGAEASSGDLRIVLVDDCSKALPSRCVPDSTAKMLADLSNTVAS